MKEDNVTSKIRPGEVMKLPMDSLVLICPRGDQLLTLSSSPEIPAGGEGVGALVSRTNRDQPSCQS